MNAQERRAQYRALEREYPKDKATIGTGLRDDLYNLKVLIERHGPTRPRSLAITHIEEAILWLEAEDRNGDDLFSRKPWQEDGGD